MEFLRNRLGFVRTVLFIPFIYGMIIPFVLFDIALEIYHHVGFWIIQKPLVPRHQYIKVDRYKLFYLNPIQKLNCAYCGYGNGLLRYAAEIAAQTEARWCAIQHEKQEEFLPPDHHKDFLAYGDKEAFDALKKENV